MLINCLFRLSYATNCGLLEQNLEEHRQLTVHEINNINNLNSDIWENLTQGDVQPTTNWKSTLSNPFYNGDENIIEYEPTEDDLRNCVDIFQKRSKLNFQPKVVTQTVPPVRETVVEENTRHPQKIDFRTGLQEFNVQNQKAGRVSTPTTSSSGNQPLFSYGATKKYLGSRINNKFVPPVKQASTDSPNETINRDYQSRAEEEEVDDRLKQIDKKMIEMIRNEIMENSTPVTWNDIAGLGYAKTIIHEAIVMPMLRPDLFTGIRRPSRGILLFGPPGTGKTLLGKCIAAQSNSTFFSISASSLTSKWIGEGEKMVRALFAVATVHQPAVVFIDEIDSLLCQRSESEHESSRRMKTEFLLQLDGVGTRAEDRILIVGATNRPQELDEAARRRLDKRLYIPLPELEARIQIIKNLMKGVQNSLTDEEVSRVGEATDGYSGADLRTVCQEASMGPIRSIPFDQLNTIDRNDVRPLNMDDFLTSLKRVRASVSPENLEQYVQWDKTYGSGNLAL